MYDWFASLGKEIGKDFIKSSIMELLSPEQQRMLQSGVPLSQVAPGLQEYVAKQQAQQQAMASQPMFRSNGGPIYNQGGMLSGYNPNGPLGFTNIGKTYDPYEYVYQPSTPEEEEVAPVAPVCTIGTMYDPTSGQCVSTGFGSSLPEKEDPLSPSAITSRSNDGINATRQSQQDLMDEGLPLLAYLVPGAGLAFQVSKGLHNNQANKINENEGSSTWQLNTNRGFGTNGFLGTSIGADKDVYTSSWGKEYDASGFSPEKRAALEKINSIADVKSYEDDWDEGDYTSDLYYKDGTPVVKYTAEKGKKQSFLEDPLAEISAMVTGKKPLDPKDVSGKESLGKTPEELQQERNNQIAQERKAQREAAAKAQRISNEQQASRVSSGQSPLGGNYGGSDYGGATYDPGGWDPGDGGGYISNTADGNDWSNF